VLPVLLLASLGGAAEEIFWKPPGAVAIFSLSLLHFTAVQNYSNVKENTTISAWPQKAAQLKFKKHTMEKLSLVRKYNVKK